MRQIKSVRAEAARTAITRDSTSSGEDLSMAASCRGSIICLDGGVVRSDDRNEPPENIASSW